MHKTSKDYLVNGINSVKTNIETVGTILNLNGMKLPHLKRGINIINAKKVFVK